MYCCKLLVSLLLLLLVAGSPSRQAIGLPAARPWLAGHLAAPPDTGRYTIVRGTVQLAQSGRPLAGVLLAVQTCSFGYLGAMCGEFTGDSTRTDRQGHYALRFYARSNKDYVIRFDPGIGRPFGQTSRFVFKTNARLVGPDGKPDSRSISEDTVTTTDFAPNFAPNYSRPIELHLPPVGH